MLAVSGIVPSLAIRASSDNNSAPAPKSIWDRTVFFVGKQRPYPSLFGVHTLEKDRKMSGIVRPMTHIIAFEELDTASKMSLVLWEDDKEDRMAEYSLENDKVEDCVLDKILEPEVMLDDREMMSRLSQMSIQAFTFDDAQSFCMFHGFVLDMVSKTEDAEELVFAITKHYPRGDCSSYTMMLESYMD
eukprot:jgi/Mesvir1/16603/Mv25196-RA.1